LQTRDKLEKIQSAKSRPASRNKRENFSLAAKVNFDKSKTKMTLDYIFGAGTSRRLDLSKIAFIHSRKTGRLKQLEDKDSGKVLFTFRSNGTVAPTALGAAWLLSYKIKPKARYVVSVVDGVSEIVSSGKTVFSKHVVSSSNVLRPCEDVIILNQKRELLAVGRAVLGGPTLKQFKRGQAVKVREGAN
jgi:predicted RNA-binding protein (TIGR00451 family)